MIRNINNALKWVAFWETSDGINWKVNDPNDPGGLTIWGIARRYHPKEVDQMNSMTKDKAWEVAKRIYIRDYWEKMKCNDLPHGIDIVLFDLAVNPGAGLAVNAKTAGANWQDMLLLRSDYYDDLKNFNLYGRGWEKRNAALRDFITSDFKILQWDGKDIVSAPQIREALAVKTISKKEVPVVTSEIQERGGFDMGTLIMKFLKLFMFKDVSEALQEDKDKPALLKKRVVGAGILAANGLLAYALGYKIDEQLVMEFVKNLQNIQDSIYQIVQIVEKSWPLFVAFWASLMAIVGFVQKKQRAKIEEVTKAER